MNKEAVNYVKFMQKMLKEKFNGKYKAPFQIEDKKERDAFFKEVKKEYHAQKKKAHVKQLDVIDKEAIQEYFSHYLENFDVKDIDMSFHLDRFDLSLWAHGKNHMYSVGSSYPMKESGESYIEVYKDLGDGKKEKIIDKMTFDNLEKAIEEIKKIEEKEVVEEKED
jgi:hypothetical protein